MVSNHFEFLDFATKDELVFNLSSKIIHSLKDAITKKGRASIAFSGGSTPKKLFQALCIADLAWDKVDVTLVDERWVEPTSDLSNEKLLRKFLLIHKASHANFIPLKGDTKQAQSYVTILNDILKKSIKKLDVVVLGMGLDGHTASFFPHAKELPEALATQSFACATTATVEPKERMTLSRNFLLHSDQLLLHIEGAEKKEIFLKAVQSQEVSQMPIISMMQQKMPQLKVYYAR